MNIGELAADLPAHRDRLAAARRAVGDDFGWYPYDILGNIVHLDVLLRDWARELDALAGGLPVADIGGADGDLAFTLEQACGWTIELIDTAPTNNNGLRGVQALRDQLGSAVSVHDIDLDSQFRLPSERYGLVFLLGILYHLQNPFYVLRELSRRADHVLLSTRVARVAGRDRTVIAHLPVGYLVDTVETNNDPTNYWMFSVTGLERLVRRAGWMVIDQMSFGDVVASDPSSMEHDERRFMLLRSERLPPVASLPARDAADGMRDESIPPDPAGPRGAPAAPGRNTLREAISPTVVALRHGSQAAATRLRRFGRRGSATVRDWWSRHSGS